MKKMIEVKNITKSFNGTVVLKELSMRVYQGEIYGFLGENGAGKTTLMKMLLNLLKADEGEIRINNHIIETGCHAYLGNIGSMIEYPAFYERLSGKENLEIHCSYMGCDTSNVISAMKMTGLKPEDKKTVGSYSLGMKQRLGLARAIVTKPDLLILDEPVNGLDPVGIREIRLLLEEICKEWGTTILISSHIVSEIESLADRVGILHNGVIISERKIEEIPGGNLEDFFIDQVKGGKSA